jgi:hypothetical protein
VNISTSLGMLYNPSCSVCILLKHSIYVTTFLHILVFSETKVDKNVDPALCGRGIGIQLNSSNFKLHVNFKCLL